MMTMTTMGTTTKSNHRRRVPVIHIATGTQAGQRGSWQFRGAPQGPETTLGEFLVAVSFRTFRRQIDETDADE